MLFAAAAVIIAVAVVFGIRTTGAENASVVVYKSEFCGCCNDWITHLRDAGFDVSVVNVASTMAKREEVGVPHRLGSCHTAVVGEYWVEGHVPADLIRRLLTERPEGVRGIAVPGMPVGSPGMEGPNPVTYDIVAYGSDGQVSVYATREGRRSPQ